MHGDNNELAISVLNHISVALVKERDVSTLLRKVLDILYREMGLIHGTITLRQNDTFYIEASQGLSEEARARGKYNLGEGVTGMVAESGRPCIIPDISHEPRFLNRTGVHKKLVESGEGPIAFICVPIIHEERVIGTLSIDCDTSSGVDLEQHLRLLETVANIIAEAVSVMLQDYQERDQLLAENRRLKEELTHGRRPADIIGNCNTMQQVYAMINQVAPSNATVLIRGASGTGKELVARAIQKGSNRSDKPFVTVNCAALPDNLIESELFGHEKGAFTGAVSRRIGRAEAADGGTLFLDEIGDISLQVQVKLLRFIQERTFSRVGSNQELHADVRILAATSRNLEQLMAEGKFREDLYYRLNVFPIHLPELRKRRCDIMLLAEFFLEKYAKVYNKEIKRISTPAINMLMSYHWPGNVRELENCMERAVLTATTEVICAYNLPPSLQTGEVSGTANLPGKGEPVDFETLVNSFERELIVEALKSNNGNVTQSAKQLGLSSRVIHYKINKYGITPDWYRPGRGKED